MYIIRKEFAFCAGHHLEGLPITHPCTEFHGHNYVVTVELRSHKLNDVGFVIDYRDLQTIKTYLDATVDHKDLNKAFNFNPTAENLAKHFYIEFKKWYPQLHAVDILETPKTLARYEH